MAHRDSNVVKSGLRGVLVQQTNCSERAQKDENNIWACLSKRRRLNYKVYFEQLVKTRTNRIN